MTFYPQQESSGDRHNHTVLPVPEHPSPPHRRPPGLHSPPEVPAPFPSPLRGKLQEGARAKSTPAPPGTSLGSIPLRGAPLRASLVLQAHTQARTGPHRVRHPSRGTRRDFSRSSCIEAPLR